jgi:hypothetical protein
MVFFIMRWLFSEGRVSYYFLNMAYTLRENKEYPDIFKDNID